MTRWSFNERMKRHAALARKLGLSNPVGRALVIEYRCRNNGATWFEYRPTLVRHLKSIQPDTADRHLRHWKRGGHPRSLHRTVVQERVHARHAGRRARRLTKKYGRPNRIEYFH